GLRAGNGEAVSADSGGGLSRLRGLRRHLHAGEPRRRGAPDHSRRRTVEPGNCRVQRRTRRGREGEAAGPASRHGLELRLPAHRGDAESAEVFSYAPGRASALPPPTKKTPRTPRLRGALVASTRGAIPSG